MKKKIKILTILLIIVPLTILSYNDINKEKVKISDDKIIEVTTISQVVISGEITNSVNREARFYTRDTSITTKVDLAGKFNLTFPLESAGYITFHHGDETTAMYCNPDDIVYITIDTKQFDETITYTGSDESNYLAWKYLYREGSSFSPDVYNSTVEELSVSLDNFFSHIIAELDKLNMNDTKFYDSELEWMDQGKEYYLKRHQQVQNVPKTGEAASNFTYPDKDGNLISLSDFKGNYVYVDIWATWCGPCKYEIPFLIQLEKDYHDANIIFMSVSTDIESKRQVWIDMINEKNMSGVQLISTDGWKSQICKDYAINGIPRFMLFDTYGNVISVDAARPSSEEIREIFDEFVFEEDMREEMKGMEDLQE